MKLHQILIGIVVLGMVMTGFMIFFANAATTYSVTDYDNETLQSFETISDISGQVQSYDGNDTEVGSEDRNDILGSFFTSAYRSAKVFKASGQVMGNMVDTAVNETSDYTGGMGKVLKDGLTTIIAIALIVGLFLAFIIKFDRV